MRTTRLQADYEKLQDMLAQNPCIRILDTVGNPPERYDLEYKVKGLVRHDKSNQVVPEEVFRVEITLTDGYPRLAPQCRAVTPVFHPNIITDAICVTDYWAAGSSLSRLVIRIAELIAFQSFGLKYPLNPDAANWVEKNYDKLPVDDLDFVALLHASEGILRAGEEDIRPTDVCITCGQSAEEVHLNVTESHHVVCDDCMYLCAHCQIPLCKKSPQQVCEECQQPVCYKCIHRCLICSKLVCFDHMTKCQVCDLGHCHDCIRQCDACHIQVCMEHSAPAERDGQHVILCENCIRET